MKVQADVLRKLQVPNTQRPRTMHSSAKYEEKSPFSGKDTYVLCVVGGVIRGLLRPSKARAPTKTYPSRNHRLRGYDKNRARKPRSRVG